MTLADGSPVVVLLNTFVSYRLLAPVKALSDELPHHRVVSPKEPQLRVVIPEHARVAYSEISLKEAMAESTGNDYQDGP